ncbi:LysM peptidoglycan-binding domain-containing protein [Saccharomonospora sp. CUA-673]|uniref:LysM peptidoglycan-binding domain-containing protein n=1 Tax=Saccharomonospora sp. CUA-673 TaxID=1904969 RepID=UPI0009F89029|nr:LysM peptidoglycan-binding domain-containing protein [Saccharomonospora sp. CUA-673]
MLAAIALAVFLGVLGVGLTANALAGAGVGDAGIPSGTAVVSVGVGESLWDVAARTAPDAEPSAVVAKIQELNNMTGGGVAAGMPLVVPAEP